MGVVAWHLSCPSPPPVPSHMPPVLTGACTVHRVRIHYKCQIRYNDRKQTSPELNEMKLNWTKCNLNKLTHYTLMIKKYLCQTLSFAVQTFNESLFSTFLGAAVRRRVAGGASEQQPLLGGGVAPCILNRTSGLICPGLHSHSAQPKARWTGQGWQYTAIYHMELSLW